MFTVSPWQSKKDVIDDRVSPSEEYLVVDEELVMHDTNKPLATTVESNAAVLLPSPPATDDATSWRTKKQEERDVTQEQLEPDPSLLESVVIDEKEDASTTKTKGDVVWHLQGTAHIVLLNDSHLLGSFDACLSNNKHTRMNIPFHGRQITAYRECTRDAEWQVVELAWALPHFDVATRQKSNSDSNRQQDVSVPAVTVAERSGGDAMRLRAPVQWVGDERIEVEVDEEESTKSQYMYTIEELTFDCETLLTDAAADVVIGKEMGMAAVQGMGAVVNVGNMSMVVRVGVGVDVDVKGEEMKENPCEDLWYMMEYNLHVINIVFM